MCKRPTLVRLKSLAAPAATPRPILERLNQALTAALKDPGVCAGFAKAGAQPTTMTLDQATKFHADEIVKYRDIIQKAGIQPQ